MLDSLFHQYIGRLVTFVLTPLLLVAVPPVTKGINDVLDTGLTDAQVTAFAITMALGLVAVVIKWLHGLNKWELAEKKDKIEQFGKDVYAEGDKLDG